MRALSAVLLCISLLGCTSTRVFDVSWTPGAARFLDHRLDGVDRVLYRTNTLERRSTRDVISIDSAGIQATDFRGDTLTIPAREVVRIEVTIQRSRKLVGAGLGALVGTVIGGAIAYEGGDQCPSIGWGCAEITAGEMAVLGGVAGFIAGAALGAVVSPGRKITIYRFGGLAEISLVPSGMSWRIPLTE